ncbi:MAG: hypothetical protein M3479_09480, partial [Actinomycetota bacterium]|nr:hypothetical protein [Actinomycetota bacterium]
MKRAAAVAAVALLVPLAPLLISLTTQEPGSKTSQKAGREAPEKPLARGTAQIRLLGINDFHGHLERSGESAGA